MDYIFMTLYSHIVQAPVPNFSVRGALSLPPEFLKEIDLGLGMLAILKLRMVSF